MNSPANIDSIHLRERLGRLGSNLWWSWDRRLDGVLRRIDADLWERLRHNPAAFVCDVTNDRLEGAAPAIVAGLIAIEDSLARYLAEPRTWAASHCGGITSGAIGYFSGAVRIALLFP